MYYSIGPKFGLNGRNEKKKELRRRNRRGKGERADMDTGVRTEK